MKTLTVTLALAALLLVGCSKEEVTDKMGDAGKKIETSTKNAADSVQAAGKDAGKTIAAVGLTAMIKSAILASPILNDDGNKIDIDSMPGHIHMKGTVKTQDMKDEAGKIAKKVLEDHKTTDMFHNDLVVGT